MQKFLGKNIVRYKAALFTSAFIEACIVFYLINSHGISVNPDSSYYISTARHIASDGSFTGYNNEAFVLLAPLYPIILALIKIVFSVDPLVSSGFINAVCLGLIITFSGLFLLKHLNSFLFIVLGTISIMVSFALVRFSLYALSEPLFILFVVLYLYFIDIYVDKNAVNSLVISAIFVSLACLTRYVGIVLILSGIITILFSKKNLHKKKFTHEVIFGTIACLPISLWIVRNYYISNTFFGSRYTSSYSFTENLAFFFNTILNWVIHIELADKYLTSIIFVIIFAAGIAALIKLKEKGIKFTEVFPSISFAAIYSSVIIISSSIFAYDRIGDRLLVPIYIPVIFITFFLIDKIHGFAGNNFFKKLSKISFGVAAIVGIFYLCANTAFIVNDYVQKSGFKFGSKAWESNSLINLVKNKQMYKEYDLYSNAPDALYILAEKESHWSPGKTHYNSPEPANLHSKLPVWNGKNRKAYLIWFNNMNRKFLFSLDELKKSVDMDKITLTNDGGIYVINPPD